MKTSRIRKCAALSLLGAGLLMPVAHAQQAKPAGGVIGKLLNKSKRGEMTKAVMNAKQIFLLMAEFDLDYGEFPNDETANSDDLLKAYRGKHSNDYLGQFLAGGYTQSEQLFFVKGGAPTDKKPDNDISTKAKTLEAGECGFAYYKGLSMGKNAAMPLLLAPMTGKGFKFDPKAFDGKAIVLRLDGSVTTYPIDANGDVILANGKRLFEGGAGTIWGNEGPDAKRLLFPK
ncbi:hypothetical protein JIN77_15095 [Verrucomicrobiaceae bacterium R5-34]|uniref:Uncharacterized protein n=1 Tax=Oceaniferula flava TaxID=2800421 RepID=A0AAE2VB51_9BACT|nr:hypothetical protein [Oceaniferula flavus]MBK1832061.1 hypothetical protein [Verrucomicrobiaceae bacterium R5-34]MBK1854145.1 hypothetical protein [Oceaniferula flavus]MBM1135451.1 hypothetical protein [Oceaniferula flavus]